MAKGKSALALALKKKIGSNDEIQKVSHWIDSGFPPLNKAISGRYDGGFPCGRIVEVFGPPSAGKCVTADTMLLTERGMVTVKELFEIEGHKTMCCLAKRCVRCFLKNMVWSMRKLLASRFR